MTEKQLKEKYLCPAQSMLQSLITTCSELSETDLNITCKHKKQTFKHQNEEQEPRK